MSKLIDEHNYNSAKQLYKLCNVIFTDIQTKNILVKAIENNDEAIATNIIERKKMVSNTDYSLLYYTISNNNPRLLSLLINKGISPNQTPEKEGSVLEFAVRKDNVDAVAILLQNGADVNIKDESGETPLFWCQSESMVRFLVKEGAEVNVRNDIGYSPLHSIVNIAAIEELCKLGADVDIGIPYTPLVTSIGSVIYKDKVPVLLRQGSSVHITDPLGRTPLHVAVILGDLYSVKMLVKFGADP
jgi:ankyrin repeat protein